MSPYIFYAAEALAGLGLGIGIMHYIQAGAGEPRPKSTVGDEIAELPKVMEELSEELMGTEELREEAEGGGAGEWIEQLSEKYGLSAVAVAKEEGKVIASTGFKTKDEVALNVLLFQNLKSQNPKEPSTVSFKTDLWEYVLPLTYKDRELFLVLRSTTPLTEVEMSAIKRDARTLLEESGEA